MDTSNSFTNSALSSFKLKYPIFGQPKLDAKLVIRTDLLLERRKKELVQELTSQVS